MDKNDPVARGGFVACSPDGLFYWPPVSIDEARQTIAKRSLYEGEPGWEILPLWLAMEQFDRESHQLSKNAQCEEVA